VCITVLTGNCLGWTVRYGRPPLLPSCRNLEFRLSASMNSDLAWVNGKSGRQSWCYADTFHRSVIGSHLPFVCVCVCWICKSFWKADLVTGRQYKLSSRWHLSLYSCADNGSARCVCLTCEHSLTASRWTGAWSSCRR